MGEVIPLGKGPEKTDAPWKFTMDFYVDETGKWSAEIVGFQPDDLAPAERLRLFCEGLDQIEMKLRQKAENLVPGEHGPVVASVKIYHDSMVKVRFDKDIINTEEQLIWLDHRLDDVKEAARQ